MVGQNVTQPAAQQSIIWIQGEAGAKAYPVQAGHTVMLMDQEAPIFYIKTSDVNGVPLPLRVFYYQEKQQQQAVQQVQQNASEDVNGNVNNNENKQSTLVSQTNNEPISQLNNYVTRQEFEEFKQYLQSSTEKEINTIKSTASNERDINNESSIQSFKQYNDKQPSKRTKQFNKHDSTVQ